MFMKKSKVRGLLAELRQKSADVIEDITATHQDEVRKLRKIIQEQEATIEGNRSIMMMQEKNYNAAVEREGHLASLKREAIEEIDAIHAWLESDIYPLIHTTQQLTDKLDVCQRAFRTVGGKYPW